MSKKNKTYSTQEKKNRDNSFTLKGGYVSVKMDNIHEHLQETKRGCGVIKSKKTYNRKKNNRIDKDYDCSFLLTGKYKLSCFMDNTELLFLNVHTLN